MNNLAKIRIILEISKLLDSSITDFSYSNIAASVSLQEEIKLRDKQIDQLTNDLEELKQCVKLLMGGE